jgi:hypothetical protein
MATSEQSSVVIINISTNFPFTPEIISELQQIISSKFDVTAYVTPNPSIVKLVEVTSDTADQDAINSIEAESTLTLIKLFEATQQTNK